MARPRKCRNVCRLPETAAFSPEGEGAARPAVILTVDEYETLRLIDREGLSQEECGERMHVARTTVQQIYTSGRRKLADMLVEGLPLRIEGGDYRLCDGGAARRGCRSCIRQDEQRTNIHVKGENIMRIAVTYENGEIFQHFGHTKQFKLYDVTGGKVTASQVVDTNGRGHGALAGVLNTLEADVLICGGIGGGAQTALAQAGIILYGGVSGEADAAVEALLCGKLQFNPNVQCNHHGEHHHHDHDCGDHGCGDHGCGGEHHCH